MEVVQVRARNAKHYRQAIRNYKEARKGFFHIGFRENMALLMS